MYPRNAASPEKIAIGPVVQISDGAVQTTGVTVRIIPDGVAEGDGAGTTAYSTDGVVLYTPTQAETNYTSFLLIAKKTGCIPASITVVTTASATPGKVVLSGETHTSAVIPTVTTLTGHTAQTGDSYARLGAPAGASIAADIATVDTVVDAVKVKTDFLPSATAGAAGGVFIAGANAATSVTTALTANITGNLSGSVGSVTGAVGSVSGNVDGNVTGSVGSLVGHTVQTADHTANIAAILTDTGTTLETHLTDIKGATFSGVTDSLEAIRDRGDAAWTTGAGGSDRLLMVDTTIATLASQTSFTLTAGSTDDGAYEGCTIVIEDVSTSTQKAIGIVDVYTGSTKTVTLLEDPGVFVMAATDKVYILAEKGLKPTTSADYHVDVSSGGGVGINWANVENPTTAVDLSATDIQLCDTVTNNSDMRGTDSAATATALATAQTDLDTLTGTDGATLATSQPNYAPATAAALATAQSDLDIITGSDGAEVSTAGSIVVANQVWANDIQTWEGIPNSAANNLNNAEQSSANAETDLANATDGLGALKALIDTIDTVVDGIKAVTDNLPSSGALTNLPVSLQQILGTTIVETTSGNIAANFDEFFDNDNALTTKVVDDVGAVVGGGDASLAKQNEILSTLSGLDSINVVSNVMTGGRIVLHQNDDHTVAASNEITLSFTDVGAVIHALTQVGGTTAKIGFRLKKGGAADDIVGTINTGSITESGGTTTIVAEVPAANTLNKTIGEYTYDVQLTTSGGDVSTILSGPATLKQDNAS